MNDPVKKSAGGILTVLFLGVLMAALDIAILGPAIPAIREAFGLEGQPRLVSWIFTAWVFANLMGVPIMSKLADKYGRKSLYLFNVTLFATGGIVVATAGSFGILLAGRAVQGLAVSGIFPVAGAVIGESIAPHKRGRSLGVLGSVFGVAFIIGPVLAGIILGSAGWRWLYLMFVPIAAVVLLVGSRTIPPSTKQAPRPFDLKGLGVLASMLLALAYSISMYDPTDQGLANPQVWVSIVVTIGLIPVFIAAERRAVDPVLRLELFSNRQVRLAGLLAAGAGVSEASFIFFPTICILAFGVTHSEASYMLIPLMVSVAIVSPIAGRLLDRTGSKTIVLTSNAVLALGMLGIAMDPGSTAVFYTSSVLIGAGLAGLMGSALSYILLHEARQEERGVSQGIITLFISIGQLLAGAAIGASAASGASELQGLQNAFLGIAVLTVLLIAVSFLLKSKTDERKVVHSNPRDEFS